MKRKMMMLLLAVSLIAIAGCGRENLQSADYSNQTQSDISKQGEYNIDNQSKIGVSNLDFASDESDNYNNKNIIICEAGMQDRVISESLDDISANSTQIINATIESVSYEIIQGNPWTKIQVKVNSVIRGDIESGDEIIIYSLGGYISLSQHIEYYNDKFRFNMDDSEIDNTMIHYVIEGESEPQVGENHIYCLQETLESSPLQKQSYERVCGIASQFDIIDNGKMLKRKVSGDSSDTRLRSADERIPMEDFMNFMCR